MKEEEPEEGKKSENDGIGKENLDILEKIKKNQRQDYLNGAVSDSVQATDRLMKELRDTYRSQSFKSGEFALGRHRSSSKRTWYEPEDGLVDKTTCTKF